MADRITVGHVGPMVSSYGQHVIPFLRSLNVKPFRLDFSNLVYIDEEFHRKLGKSSLRPGDVVVVRTGNPGAAAVVPNSLPDANCSDLVIVKCGSKLDPAFTCYYINSVTGSHVKNQVVGAIQKHFNIGSAKELPFPKILRDRQEKIAAVLSALDAKIDLNNRINAELEAMARTLYDYWFVQFDFPDENGRPYNSSGGKMVYSPVLKREIPEGWEARMLGEIANITMGQSPPGNSLNQNGIGVVFFQGSTDFGAFYPRTRTYTRKPSRMAKQGDILLSVRAPVGDMNVAAQDCCIGRGLSALHSKDGYDGFLFFVMRYFRDIFRRRNAEGTTFGSITKDDLHSLYLVYPPPIILNDYDKVVSRTRAMIFNRSSENESLSQLRDWLLPMLMNGQVTVE